jgi:hypothetical protein
MADQSRIAITEEMSGQPFNPLLLALGIMAMYTL